MKHMRNSLFSLLLSAAMLLAAFAPLTALLPQTVSAAADGIEVLSAVKEPESWVYTLTFSEPVHIFKQGYFWLRQANAHDGTAQCSCTKIEYLGDVTKKGSDSYSTTLRLTFADPSSAFNQEAYGISMVEYFLSDTNAGYVSPQVIAGKDGKMLKGNYVNGSLDFTWVPTDARDSANAYPVHITERQIAPNLLYVDILSDTVAAFIFDTEVTPGSLSGLTASANGATASVKAIKEGAPSVPYTIVVEFDRAIDKVDFDMKASFANSAKGVPTSPKKAKFSDMVPPCDLTIESGERYSLMNCDTGRLLTYDGQEEFRIVANENGTFSLQSADGTKYLYADASGKLSFREERTDFRLITSNDYSRVQLHLFGAGVLLSDSDAGTTSAAETAQQKPGSAAIETGWYLTKHGDPLPMRVAMLGDSITNGCTPEGTAPKPGCRAQLSAALIAKYGRVVFVGSAVASHGGDGSGGPKTTVNDPFLYRSEGHNGWVVTSKDGYKPANNYGIDTLIPNLMTKYQPDIICMMIGINDLNQLGQLDAVVNNQPAGDAFFARWSTLARDILSRMKENDRLIVGTYTPFRSGNALDAAKNAKVSVANDRLRQAVAALSDTRVSIAENYDHVIKTGVEGISTDGIHLTAKGYSALGDSYYEAIVKVAEGTTDAIVDDTPTGEESDPAATGAPSSDDESDNQGTGNNVGLYSILAIGSLLLLGAAALTVKNRRKAHKQ